MEPTERRLNLQGTVPATYDVQPNTKAAPLVVTKSDRLPRLGALQGLKRGARWMLFMVWERLGAKANGELCPNHRGIHRCSGSLGSCSP
jgi:hypothetical protein